MICPIAAANFVSRTSGIVTRNRARLLLTRRQSTEAAMKVGIHHVVSLLMALTVGSGCIASADETAAEEVDTSEDGVSSLVGKWWVNTDPGGTQWLDIRFYADGTDRKYEMHYWDVDKLIIHRREGGWTPMKQGNKRFVRLSYNGLDPIHGVYQYRFEKNRVLLTAISVDDEVLGVSPPNMKVRSKKCETTWHCDEDFGCANECP